MRPTPDGSALTLAARRVDGRLTALCHAGVNKTVSEQVRRMSSQDPGQEANSADQAPAHAISREEHWSYLLRLWRAGGDGGWRASLQSIPAGERHMFADLESLLTFLLTLSQ
jgi:hypothetical protein